MPNLPEVQDAEELKGLDVAGLQAQLGLAQKALEILHEDKKVLYDNLIQAQNIFLEAQKKTHSLKINLKDNTNNAQKYLERIKIIKIMLRTEAQ